MNSVSAFVLQVSDLEKSVKFYDDLGFVFKNREDTWARAYLNWFWVELQVGKVSAGDGVAQYISVDSAADFYKWLVGEGFKPESQPKLSPQGRTEFALRDPDGYRLVFFSKK